MDCGQPFNVCHQLKLTRDNTLYVDRQSKLFSLNSLMNVFISTSSRVVTDIVPGKQSNFSDVVVVDDVFQLVVVFLVQLLDELCSCDVRMSLVDLMQQFQLLHLIMNN